MAVRSHSTLVAEPHACIQVEGSELPSIFTKTSKFEFHIAQSTTFTFPSFLYLSLYSNQPGYATKPNTPVFLVRHIEILADAMSLEASPVMFSDILA